MSSYIVLARKWRPQTFADLVGQQHIAVTLRNAIAQNRVAHAFLFTGSRGVGKTSTARIFAKALNCEHSPCDEPCNECQSCCEITEGHSMDVIEIDGASNRGINEIREVLEAVRYAPSRDRYKIYIIDEVHMLTTEAFNALLKTLEEPPQHVVFIFATTDPNKVPITIISRCQRYDFKRITEDDLSAHLARIAESEHIQFEESALRLIARTARGGVRDALSAMDQIIAFAEQPISGERAAEVLGVASRETLMKMGECVLKKDAAGALSCIEKVDHYGQNLSQFAFDLLEFWRDVTVLAAAPNAPVELNASEKEIIKSWLPLAGMERLQRIFSIWYQTSEMLPKSLSPRLVMEMATIRMCQVENVVPLDGILRRIDAITKAIGPSANISPDALSHIQEYLNRQGLFPLDEKKKLIPRSESADTHGIARDEQPVNAVSKAEAPRVETKPVVETVRVETKAAPAPPREETKAVAETSQTPEPAQSHSKVFNDLEPPAFLDDIAWDDNAPEMTSEDMESLSASWNEYADVDPGEDADGEESTINAPEIKKILEVSADRPKTSPPEGRAGNAELSSMQRWKQVVTKLGEPLSTIMARARIDCFSKCFVEVTLPNVYRDMVSEAHIREITRILAKDIYQGCRFAVHYDEISDETETLAAQEARVQLEAQQKAFERVHEHPIMKTIIEVFHVNSDDIRFTINPDRTSNEQSH